MPHPHLEKAPIVEALVDLRVDVPLDSLTKLDTLAGQFAEEFPERKNLALWSGTFNLHGAQPLVTSDGPQIRGYGFWSDDKTRVVQARLDGFSFSRLAPYSHWTDLRDSARKYWNAYAAATGATGVNRCALRYINRLELPRTSDLRDYLLTRPSVSS